MVLEGVSGSEEPPSQGAEAEGAGQLFFMIPRIQSTYLQILV